MKHEADQNQIDKNLIKFFWESCNSKRKQESGVKMFMTVENLKPLFFDPPAFLR